MNIFVCCSKHCYDHVPQIKAELEAVGHSVTLPNCFDDSGTEERRKAEGADVHAEFKGWMLRNQADKVEKNDAVLVLNFEKKGVKNYIGGATFLEMYEAFRTGKKLFLFNDIPEGILTDEIKGFSPIIINQDLSKVV